MQATLFSLTRYDNPAYRVVRCTGLFSFPADRPRRRKPREALCVSNSPLVWLMLPEKMTLSA